MNSLTRHFAKVADSAQKQESFDIQKKGFWTPEVVAIAIFLGGYILIRLGCKFFTFVIPEWIHCEISSLYKWAPILVPIAVGLSYSSLPNHKKKTDSTWLGTLQTDKKIFTPEQKKSIGMRQGGKCAVCMSTLPTAFEVHYTKPLWDGGIDSLENMQALCLSCYSDKTLKERMTLYYR